MSSLNSYTSTREPALFTGKAHSLLHLLGGIDDTFYDATVFSDVSEENARLALKLESRCHGMIRPTVRKVVLVEKREKPLAIERLPKLREYCSCLTSPLFVDA